MDINIKKMKFYIDTDIENELKCKINEYEKYNFEDDYMNGILEGEIKRLEEILSNSTVLPSYKNWEDFTSSLSNNKNQTIEFIKNSKGVIINQNKKNLDVISDYYKKEIILKFGQWLISNEETNLCSSISLETSNYFFEEFLKSYIPDKNI